MEAPNFFNDEVYDSPAHDELITDTEVAVSPRPRPTEVELYEQFKNIEQDINEQLSLVTDTPEYKAINATAHPDVEGFSFVAEYDRAHELLIRAHYSRPGNANLEDVTPTAEIYEELDGLAPTLYEQSVLDFAKQVHEHVARVSPSKRDRVAQQPERWDFAALARQQREKFFSASRRIHIVGGEDIDPINELVSSALMASTYTLLGRKDTEPLSTDQAHELGSRLYEQLLNPVIGDRFHSPDDKDKLSVSLLESYREAFSGDTVDYPTISRLNDLAGETADAHIVYLMIEQLIIQVTVALENVRETTKMRNAYFNAIRVLHANDAGAFIETGTDALRKVEEELMPALGDIEVQLTQLAGGNPAPQDARELPEIEQMQPLNWEILPPGQLEQISRDIVRDAQTESRTPTIDLERLKILENIRNRWGAEDCYYARGALSARRVIRDGTQSEADQYLMLILREKNSEGSVVAEHAIAESPIAGPHALYVFRQDVSEGLDWRDVMALPKSYAQDFGARAVKHSLPRGEADLVHAMTEKVSVLMSATPEEFATLQFNGTRGIRFARGVLRMRDGTGQPASAAAPVPSARSL